MQVIEQSLSTAWKGLMDTTCPQRTEVNMTKNQSYVFHLYYQQSIAMHTLKDNVHFITLTTVWELNITSLAHQLLGYVTQSTDKNSSMAWMFDLQC